MSMDEEWIRGSSPGGFLVDWIKKHGIDQKTLDRKTPQISMIPKEQIKDYLLAEFKGISTMESRQEHNEKPRLREIITSLVRENFAAIDWAEQTYGIKIDVDPEILNWIGKNK